MEMPKISNKISYRHIRSIEAIRLANGSLIFNKLLPRGGACIAYTIITDTNDTDNVILAFNWAKCHVTDIYNKKRAREMASGRLLSNFGRIKEDEDYNAYISIPSKIDRKTINAAISKYFEDNAHTMPEISQINKLIKTYMAFYL